MLLLALDTSSATASVALVDDDQVRASRDLAGADRPTDLVAPAIRDVLAEAGARPRDLGAVAVGTGPGPFTGLRAGIVTARSLALTLAVPCVGIGSLDALAHAVSLSPGAPAGFAVATDARRREVYWAVFTGGERVAGPGVGPAADVPRDGLPVAGRGALLYPDRLGQPAVEVLDPPATSVAALALRALGGGGPVTVAEPQYLRRPDAREPGPRKRVLT